jgi:hypothetical protein
MDTEAKKHAWRVGLTAAAIGAVATVFGPILTPGIASLVQAPHASQPAAQRLTPDLLPNAVKQSSEANAADDNIARLPHNNEPRTAASRDAPTDSASNTAREPTSLVSNHFHVVVAGQISEVGPILSTINDKSGTVFIECLVNMSGRLVSCKSIYDFSQGGELSEAAIKILSTFIVQTPIQIDCGDHYCQPNIFKLEFNNGQFGYAL